MGQKAPEITEAEIALNSHQLAEIWSEIGPICVKRKSGDCGVALMRPRKVMPVWIYPCGHNPDPFDAIVDYAPGVERFATWRAAAAAGWQVD